MTDAEFRADFIDRMSEVVERDAVERWMVMRHKFFGHRSPDELIQAGERDRLEEVLYRLGSGEPT